MNRSKTAVRILATLAIVTLTAGVANAAPVIYEPFADSDSTLNGNTCGSGLTNNWTANIGTITTPSIVWGSLATSGNKVADVYTGRFYANTGTTLDGLLDDGDTLWFSVLIINGDVSTNPDFAFALGTDSLISNSSNMETGGGGNGLGFRHKGNNGGLNAVRWSGGGVLNGVGTLGQSAGDTHLFVGEMIFGATNRINIYMPGTDLKPGSVLCTQTSTVDQTQFDTISFGIRQVNTTPYVIDEIRFGATYDDVVPVPAGAPTIVSMTPTNEAIGVSKSTDLVATFSKPVQLTGSGTVTLTNMTLNTAMVINLPDAQVALADNAFLTIDPTDYLSNGTHYAVLISSNALKDFNAPTNQAFAGISDQDEWDFTTSGDSTPPTLQSSSPADESVGVSVYGDLTASFSEDLVLTGDGNVTIRNVTMASDELVINLPDASVYVAATNLTINPSINLDTSMVYAVQISSDAVEDLAGNLFAGTVDETSWNFTTIATPHFVWTGALDGDWNNAGNWNANGVPIDDNPASSALTFPQNGNIQRIRFAAYGSSNPLPTANIPVLGGGWSGGEYDTPSIDMLHGGTLALTRTGPYWSGAGVTFLTVGDGDVDNGTNTVDMGGVSQLNRQCDGTQRWVVNADGMLNFTTSTDLSFAYNSGRAAVVTLAGGTVTVNGGLTSLASTQAGARPSYIEFTMPGGTLTAKYGGEFANVAAVQAEIGDSKSFRIGSTGLDKDVYIDAVDNGTTFTLTLIDPPAAGTVLIVR